MKKKKYYIIYSEKDKKYPFHLCKKTKKKKLKLVDGFTNLDDAILYKRNKEK